MKEKSHRGLIVTRMLGEKIEIQESIMTKTRNNLISDLKLLGERKGNIVAGKKILTGMKEEKTKTKLE